MNSHGNVAVLLHPLPIIHETRWCKYLIEIGVPLEFVNSLLVIQILFCLYFQGEIRHEPTGQCIDRGDKKGGGSLVVMNPCDGSSNQKWKFAHYNTTKHTTWYEYTVWKKTLCEISTPRDATIPYKEETTRSVRCQCCTSI